MNIEDLMENVHDFFIEKYEGVDKSSSFLSFEPLGTVIDPEDFEHETEEISELQAREQLSIMGDRLPEINPMYLTNTFRLSDVYEDLIKSSQFTGVKINLEDKSKYIAKFSEVRSEVVQKFEDASKSSITTPEGMYLPVYGSPKKWFDPKGSFWMAKSFSAKGPKKTAASKGTKTQKMLVPLMWRPKLEANVLEVKGKAKTKQATPVKKAIALNKLQTQVLAKPVFSKVHFASQPKRNRAALSKKPSPVKVQPKKKPKSVKAKTKLASNFFLNDLSVLKHLQVAERARLTNTMAQNTKVPTEPVHSNEFSMSFEYCIVKLHRPWFDSSLFHYRKLWYSMTHDKGYFSTGAKDETNKGVLKCIPTAMIIIKNLKLTAAWTEDDKKNAKSSVGLGIFNVNDSVFMGNDLVNPGMQIIGWMCQVMPEMPVLNDPNISME